MYSCILEEILVSLLLDFLYQTLILNSTFLVGFAAIMTIGI
ncbi:hypothetical protein RINTHH_16990 [Richelia intracellularis HH01]|uniref:Uncharacterized protein n=1 Tax=Richelia intracellularis HH01 TaxID=1165094 RepID=M1WT68_9NOST|nr:hypothetical protein RINTHH_16990 [Richelia intracellularis HH01]